MRLEDVDVVRGRQPIQVALGTVLPRLRRPTEAVPAPLMRMRLLHRSRVTCERMNPTALTVSVARLPGE